MVFQPLKSKKLIVVVLFVLLLVAFRIALASIMVWYVNRIIDETPGISGAVKEVDIAFIQGAYQLNQVNLYQEGDNLQQPLLLAPQIELSVLWSALFEGRIVTEIMMIEPKISLFDQPKDDVIESDSVLNEKTWLGLATDLTPLAIDKLTVVRGAFVMDAKDQLKRASFSVEDVELEASNIAVAPQSPQIAELAFSGKVQGTADLSLTASFDPNEKVPTFDMDLEMDKINVSYLDALVKFYSPVDFEAGHIDFASELKAEKGAVTGYFKVGIYELEVFSWQEDAIEDDDNPIELLGEVAGGMVAEIFENNDEQLIATRIPISGDLSNPDISAWVAFKGVVKNAFVQAYDLKLEDSINGLKVTSPSE
ncbi:DUF748 domain-containing protein [Paraglaciecola marina]|uniref:DUF748 domain-containing protein n=1 Tax=Paraglaciecola marina TaxID=2500157 RepID=UPI00105F613D|nr:DUF748 domain-containing protein [Paraglaciecola marina]